MLPPSCLGAWRSSGQLRLDLSSTRTWKFQQVFIAQHLGSNQPTKDKMQVFLFHPTPVRPPEQENLSNAFIIICAFWARVLQAFCNIYKCSAAVLAFPPVHMLWQDLIAYSDDYIIPSTATTLKKTSSTRKFWSKRKKRVRTLLFLGSLVSACWSISIFCQGFATLIDD